VPLTQAILVSTRRLGTSSALTVNPISVARRIANDLPHSLQRSARSHSLSNGSNEMACPILHRKVLTLFGPASRAS